MTAATAEELFRLYSGHIVPRAFNPGFITLSYVVSLIGAASTLELLNRRTSPKGMFNHLLLISSAVTMGGIAIWCMHFIGNRAIDLAAGEPELQIAYSSGFTALSFFVPIAVLFAAFVAVGTNNTVSWWRVTVGGILAGAAICGMHYLGNNSIDNYVCIYNPVNVVGAALIAVAASIVALALFFIFRAAWTNAWWKRGACSVVLAGAVSGMHWVAATGTEYQLVRLNTGSNELSRNTTVIVVICLSIGACFVMAGTAVYTARVMRRYASKAQQVVLAAAVFDRHGRILVNPDGLLPSEKITDTFLEKNSSDNFSIAHPLFHWMFQASRNWSGISALVGGMANHLAHLPKTRRDRDSRADIQLINEHGELIENYDLIFRELFCMAAVGLADKMKEHLSSVGSLWDEIVPTGSGGERRGELQRRHQEIDGILQNNGNHRTTKSPTTAQAEDLAEKGVRQQRPHEFGRGSLMFLVRRVHTDQDVERLQAAGFRFAEVRQVSGIIENSMQIKSRDFEQKLKNMASYSEDKSYLQPGVHVGFFGIRARVGSFGFDVLVRKSARNLLPTMQMPVDRIEPWHIDFLRQFDRMTASAMAKKIDGMKRLSARETLFASQLFDAWEALRAWTGDAILDEAVLTPTVMTIPRGRKSGSSGGPPQPTSLIAFRLVIPIHVNISKERCDFIPLNFFKIHQIASSDSGHALAFAQSVHRELAPILQLVPVEKPKAAASNHRRRTSFRQSGITSPLRLFNRSGRPIPVDAEGNPIPTVFGRMSGTSTSNKSGSTLKLWPARRSNSYPNSPGSSTIDGPPAYQPREGMPQPPSAAFGGIMVSEEIRVEVHDAEDVTNVPSTDPRSARKRPATLMGRRASAGNAVAGTDMEPTVGAAEMRRNTSAVGGAIEMKAMSGVRVNVHAGTGTQVSNVEAEGSGSDTITFVDELFAICVDGR